MPQVSIIMPCHNGEKFIRESIESVISQTFKDWELLVIDDNSTDTSVDLIDSFIKNDTRIKLLRNEKSTGFPATPRNLGIKQAQGRYIAFLDCDDVWLSNKLDNQIKLFDERTSVVYSYYKKMDENGSISDSIVKSPSEIAFKGLLNGNCIGNLTGIYDAEKIGKIYQKEIHHEDYVMWLEILKNGNIAKNTNTVEAIYRESKKSTSGNKLKAFSWTWNIYRSELRLSFLESVFHFCIYAFKGMLKFFK